MTYIGMTYIGMTTVDPGMAGVPAQDGARGHRVGRYLRSLRPVVCAGALREGDGRDVETSSWTSAAAELWVTNG